MRAFTRDRAKGIRTGLIARKGNNEDGCNISSGIWGIITGDYSLPMRR